MSGTFGRYNSVIKGLFILFLLLSGLFSIFRWVLRPPDNVSSSQKTDYSISSNELIATFLEDEANASAIYVEKTLEVEGVVKDITFFNDRYTVLLQGGNSISSIMCDMQDDQVLRIDQIQKGDTIVLKGICKGFLMDAILLNCILINHRDE